MADKIDKLLSDYYSGIIDMQITQRKKELQVPTLIDENIGGGRAENKHTRPLDDRLIVEESDYILQSFIRDQYVLSNFLKILNDDERSMLSLKYDRRRKRSWYQVARMLSKSESQCYRDMTAIKKIYRESMFKAVDNSNP